MKVMLWFLVRLCCVFLLIFLHASFGTTEIRGGNPPSAGSERDQPRYVRGSPNAPPGSHL
ncbi:hypothetical protein I3842_15G130700 [Carya illinoinensis]|uniref:Uncharacterized protein n=1 Tax=Carya illinoinensis TaxID=32201 RepID=A0A922AC22_CARIL|nr:hypothetical protein I3842_15G130700 [Carya illinoinensis]